MANIDGTSAGETLIGTSDPDVIRGFEGNDTLDGREGADQLEGGTGDDVFIIDNPADVIVELLGEGFDALFTNVSYTLAAGVSLEWISTALTSSTAAINLTGNEIANYLIGNNGANTLNGGGGADIMIGFAGDDVYLVDNAGDAVTENAGEGFDAILTDVSYVLAAGVSLEWLSTSFTAGTAAINLTGNETANFLIGNNGNNSLNGGGGADIMTGFAGDDVYLVDTAGDLVNENAGEGFDAILANVSYVLAAGVSVEWLSTSFTAGTAAINLTGNEIANFLIGNNGANTLNGGGGADVMTGFAGDDVYLVDSAGDVVNESAGQGFDAILTDVSYVLAAGVSLEWLSTSFTAGTAAINLTGNEIANFLIGNNGANTLNGSGGADVMTGFAGDDVYLVDNAGDVVNENAGEGFDAILTDVSYTLAGGVSLEWLSTSFTAGTTAINLTGNEIANYLLGNNGANTLDGGAGADVMTGFAGADNFAFTGALGAGNVDSVTDFSVADDTIQLGGAVGQPFAALATGALRTGTLVIGTAALDADDYLIYNSGTGALLYDADGNGAGAAVQFATLGTGLGLTVADFFVTGAVNSAPAITSGATASIAENSAASTIVYQTAANDADGDRITYSLSGADAGLLTIDANGAVRLINPADFETKAVYSFNVVVSDSGVSTQKAVTLTITDVNENISTPTINEIATPNDSRFTAQSIDPGTFLIANNPNLPNDDYPSATIVGNITGTSDVDFYSITLQAGQQLILDVDGTTTSLDSFLSLYGPTGTFIGENDDLGTPDPGSNPPFPHNTDSQIIFRAATSGTYYFSIGSFEQGSQGAYQLHVSVNSTPATAEQIMAEDVEALVSGAAWNRTTLTYGFPTAASQYPQDFDEVADPPGPTPAPTFEAFSALQQAATRSLLQLVANVSPLTFTERTGTGPYTDPNSSASADLRYAETNEAEVAYAYLPTNMEGPSSESGSAWFNHDDFNNPIRGNYAWMGILHETGHALGLKHGHEFPLAISADHDSTEYSVMTYRSYPGDDVEGYGNEQYGYPQTLMMLDIAALQKIYDGANFAFNQGNSTYTWDSNTGEMSINGVGQGAPGNGVGGSANRVFLTVWDGNGIDTYDMSNYNNANTIDLRPGEWSTTSPDQLANLRGGAGGPHFARGNVANALLFEGDVRSAIENAKGGAGADTLIANLVANNFTGNGGADTFKWMATGDAGMGSLADTVLDFVRGSDKIDFSNLDANAMVPGQQDFAFIGTGAFTGAAGQVRYDVTGGSAHIFADTNGNGTADMEIILTNITTLAVSDFNF
ncbi:MAG TPA: M10 family metallopeptidase C-terminal domain-containing protein [Allosphingosinicella sp.]|nr:M10 family metallopeptidase C-terminal domain-containing protein [Allosphingosinicella sp.]